jgi:hypothetical protein
LGFFEESLLFRGKIKKAAVLAFAIFLVTAGCALFIQPAKALSVPVLSSSGYHDIIDGFWIFGELQNLESSPVRINFITATYYDASNTVIATVDWYFFGYSEYIYPNQKAPFLVLLWNSTTGAVQIGPRVDHYTLDINSTAVSPTTPPPQINILSYNTVFDQNGYMNVTGVVENAGTQYSNYTTVYLTCYGADSKVVYIDTGHADINALAPGQTSAFSMLYSGYPDLTPLFASCSLSAGQTFVTYAVTPPAAPTPTPSPTSTPTIASPPSSSSSSSSNTQSTTPTQTQSPSPPPTPSPTPSSTPTTSPPSTSPPTPNPNQQDNNPNQNITYTVWAPQHSNAAAATVTTIVAVCAVSAVVVALANPVGAFGRAAGKIHEFLPEGFKKWLEEFLSSRRKSALREKTGSPFMPTKGEVLAYAVSLAALTFAFSYVKAPNINLIFSVLPTILATAVIVELAKTYILEVFARFRGLWTEHKLWYVGLVMFLVTTFSFGVPFSSPSRNVYHSPKMTKQLQGLVASVAVLVTMAFAGLFFILLISGFALIGGTGLAMCVIMGLVDTFPVEPLNGKAIFDHKKALWAAFFLVNLTIYLSWLLLL